MKFGPNNTANLDGRPPVYKITLADLKRMREARMGRGAIAAVYGCNETTVRHWLVKFGLPTKLEPIAPSPEAIDAAIAAKTASLPKPKDA